MSIGWLSYGGLLVLGSALSLIKMLAYARLMSPEPFGIVSTLLSTYALLVTVGSVGLIEGSLKSAAMTKIKYEREKMVGAALSAGIVTTAIISSIVVTFLTVFNDLISFSLSLGLVLLALVAFAFNISEVSLRACGRFRSFAIAVFSKALLSLVLGVAVVYAGMPNGVIVTEMLAFLVVFLGILRSRSSELRFRFPELTTFIELVRIGLPIAVGSVIKKLSFLADRWMILLLFGPYILGQYSFLMLLHLIGISAIGVINSALGPILLGRMTDRPSREVVADTITSVIKALFPVSLLACIAVFVLFEPTVNKYFPRYANDIFAYSAVFVIAGMVFLAAQSILEWLLIGQNLTHKVIEANLVSLIVMIGSIFGSVSSTEPLQVLCKIFFGVRLVALLFVLFSILRSPGWNSFKRDNRS